MRKLLSAFASNVVFANITIFLMFLVGALAMVLMRREMFPEMSLDRVVISVPYPGADPEEVEEGILRKIEDALQGEDGIKEITTRARENMGTAMITVEESASTRTVLDRVRSKVDGISTFPPDAENPVITELLLTDPVVIVSLSGNMPEHRMKEWAERLKLDLLDLPEITSVDIFGARDYEISIELAEATLRGQGLSLQQVMDAVRAHNLNVPGGILRGESEEIRLRVLGRKYRADEIAGIPLLTRADGRVLRLGEVATIVDAFTEDPLRARVNGAPALFLYVNKTSQQDAIDISDATRGFIEARNQNLPEGLRLGVILDTTDMLRARIDLLVRNGIIGLALVFVLLWFFLDLRMSFWAGMGMPISIAGALVILWAIGGSLNMISLFGLIMVLGIIVDDAIVVGEAIYHHQSKPGANPFRAAVEGVSEVAMPVLGSVTTTIVAFLPLLFVGGIMGKFIGILPVVVIACLSVSLFECLFMLPAHLGESVPSRPDRARGPLHRLFATLHRHTGDRLERIAAGPYQNFLTLALRNRYVALSAAIALLILTLGGVAGGRIGFRMFPEFDSFLLTATVEFPAGTPVEVTERALDQIDASVAALNQRVTTRSGRPLVLTSLRLAGQSLSFNQATPATGSNVGSVQVVLVESTDREWQSDRILAEWESLIGQLPGADALTVEGLNAGPPGKPVDIRIRGTEMARLTAAADDLKGILDAYPGATQIQTDFRPGKNELRFRLRPEAFSLGVSVEDLGRQLSTAYYGGEALRLQRGRDDLRVMVRLSGAERSRVADLDRLRIRTRDGRQIPLTAIADLETSPGFSDITRVDGLRAVGVGCNVNKDLASADFISRDLSENHFPALRRTYPGLTFEFQGEQKDSAESITSLQIGFPIALVGIYIIIATIFRSYVQPILIMATVPFGIIGAIGGHLLKGLDLSLMSLFGIVALAGVVVNDAIVLVEAYNRNIASGMNVLDALHNAGSRRFRAVFLTTLSTVGGLTPLILETDLQAQFLIPMALSIAAGVAFATLLTLLLLPSLVLILNDLRCFFHLVFTGSPPATRAAVEPARHRIHLES